MTQSPLPSTAALTKAGPPPTRPDRGIGLRRYPLLPFASGGLCLWRRLLATLPAYPLSLLVGLHFERLLLLLLIPMMLAPTLLEVAWLLALYILLLVDHLQLAPSVDQHLVF